MSTRKPAGGRMTQAEIIDHIVSATSLNRKQVIDLFAELVSLAQREVKADKEFVLPGIGKLFRMQRKPRQGRNPLTGEQIDIPAKETIKFRVNNTLTAGLAGDNTTKSDI